MSLTLPRYCMNLASSFAGKYALLSDPGKLLFTRRKDKAPYSAKEEATVQEVEANTERAKAKEDDSQRPPVKSGSKALDILGRSDEKKGKKERANPKDEDEDQAFFCSELVAECLMKMGIIKAERTAS